MYKLMRGVNYSRTKIFWVKKSRQFFSGFWDFFPKFKGFFSADFFKIFSLIFFPQNFLGNFLQHIIRRIFFKRNKSTEGHFHANSRFKCLNLMGFPNIAIILRILWAFSK
jgi:hypothetical protein